MYDLIMQFIENSFGSWDDTLNTVIGLVTQSPQSFNSVAYSMIQGVYYSLLPIAYNLLALFFLIELLSKSATLEVMRWEQVAKILFKMVLAKVVIENAFRLMNVIFTISSSAVTNADMALSALGTTANIIDEVKNSVPNTGNWFENLWGQLGFFISFLPSGFFLWAMRLAVYVIAYGRMIEIYLLTAVASLPIATFTSSGLQNIGKKFFQSYAGVCLQGMFILIIVKLYGAIVAGAAISGEDIVGKMLITSLVTVSLLVKSGTWAKQITGAA